MISTFSIWLETKFSSFFSSSMLQHSFFIILLCFVVVVVFSFYTLGISVLVLNFWITLHEFKYRSRAAFKRQNSHLYVARNASFLTLLHLWFQLLSYSWKPNFRVAVSHQCCIADFFWYPIFVLLLNFWITLDEFKYPSSTAFKLHILHMYIVRQEMSQVVDFFLSRSQVTKGVSVPNDGNDKC